MEMNVARPKITQNPNTLMGPVFWSYAMWEKQIVAIINASEDIAIVTLFYVHQDTEYE